MSWEKDRQMSDGDEAVFKWADIEAQVLADGGLWILQDETSPLNGVRIKSLEQFILALQQLKQEALLHFGEEWGK